MFFEVDLESFIQKFQDENLKKSSKINALRRCKKKVKKKRKKFGKTC